MDQIAQWSSDLIYAIGAEVVYKGRTFEFEGTPFKTTSRNEEPTGKKSGWKRTDRKTRQVLDLMPFRMTGVADLPGAYECDYRGFHVIVRKKEKGVWECRIDSELRHTSESKAGAARFAATLINQKLQELEVKEESDSKSSITSLDIKNAIAKCHQLLDAAITMEDEEVMLSTAMTVSLKLNNLSKQIE
jgi:hypothetical protein